VAFSEYININKPILTFFFFPKYFQTISFFRSTSLSGQQETRVANLESRLQELSETVGTYDRLRQNDQMSMQKLRDRIAQLDLENQSLQNVRRNDSLPGRLLYCILQNNHFRSLFVSFITEYR
jgi:hypothetical protein